MPHRTSPYSCMENAIARPLVTASLQCHDLGGAHKVDGVAVAAQCGHGVDVTAAGVISSETSASRLDGFTRERSSTTPLRRTKNDPGASDVWQARRSGEADCLHGLAPSASGRMAWRPPRQLEPPPSAESFRGKPLALLALTQLDMLSPTNYEQLRRRIGARAARARCGG